jgi:tripartite-type tricarboxylate transporter receptor subunit TctC
MVRKPEIQSRLRADGLVPEIMSIAEFRGFIIAEAARWKPMLKAAGLAAP